MSIAEIERFAADLKSNSALRAEADKSQADKSHGTPLERSVAFAVGKGYAFTIDEARQHVKARAAAAGKILTDAELDGVVGASAEKARNTPLPNCTVRSFYCTSRPGGPCSG
jgi:hypothetical protein